MTLSTVKDTKIFDEYLYENQMETYNESDNEKPIAPIKGGQ